MTIRLATSSILSKIKRIRSLSSASRHEQGLLGFHNVDEIFDHPHVLNNVAFLFSTASKLINRKATSYGQPAEPIFFHPDGLFDTTDETTEQSVVEQALVSFLPRD